jgi:Na+-transporting methylmalonyl-CoA/oxaloacetate decarboxylase gamma subunit
MDFNNPTIANILLIALVGIITVFVVLVMLMAIISLITKLFGDEKAKPVVEAPKPEQPKDEYTGVKLINVSEKEAAILMAIVANKLDKPLENLRFISIKEVK